jgi:nitroreductase
MRRTWLVLLIAGLGCSRPSGAAGDAAAAPSTTTATLAFVPGQPIALPAPDTRGGLPLMAALAGRRSTRDLGPEPLPLGVLGDLLWAAAGVNRPDGKRTAATALNWQNIDVYVVTPRGVFRYDAGAHALAPVDPDDARAATGRQSFVAEAPLNLVYVADTTKEARGSAEERLTFDGAAAGAIAQDVYLFAASAGLGAVVRAAFDPAVLGPALRLAPTQRIVLAQTVGYPR